MSDNWGLPTAEEKEAQERYDRETRKRMPIWERIGFNLAGFRIKIHWTLLLMFILFTATSPAGFATGAMMWAVMMGSVLLHELGHSVVSRWFGYPIKVIVLHILGGTAIAEKLPIEPGKRLCTYAAGPLVSILIALSSGFILMTFKSIDSAPYLLMFTFVINAVLTVFNLIPLFPLDGGGIMHSINLMLSKNHKKACRRTAIVSVLTGAAAIVFLFSRGAIWGGVILMMMLPINIHLYKNGDGLKPWNME